MVLGRDQEPHKRPMSKIDGKWSLLGEKGVCLTKFDEKSSKLDAVSFL